MQLLAHILKPKSECHYKSLDPRSGTRSYARRELATLSAYGTNACIPTDLNASSRRRAVVKRSRASTRRRLQTQWQETALSAVSSDAANSRGSQHDEGFTRTFTNVPRYHTLQAWPNNTTLRAPLNSCKMTDPLKFCSQPQVLFSASRWPFLTQVLIHIVRSPLKNWSWVLAHISRPRCEQHSKEIQYFLFQLAIVFFGFAEISLEFIAMHHALIHPHRSPLKC